MIIVAVKENENIERALKRFKRKFEKTRVMREIRARKVYKKPSQAKREMISKAVYIQGLKRENDEV